MGATSQLVQFQGQVTEHWGPLGTCGLPLLMLHVPGQLEKEKGGKAKCVLCFLLTVFLRLQRCSLWSF